MAGEPDGDWGRSYPPRLTNEPEHDALETVLRAVTKLCWIAAGVLAVVMFIIHVIG